MRPAVCAAGLLLTTACASVPAGSTAVAAEEKGTTATSAAAGVAPSTTSARASGGVLSEPTGAVLVFDDGIDGVFSVDLDNRIAARRVLEGQRAGDAPYRLVRVGDTLVVGWGVIRTLSIDTLEARHLREATIFLPAEEPETVWLIDYPGGRIAEGRPTYL